MASWHKDSNITQLQLLLRRLPSIPLNPETLYSNHNNSSLSSIHPQHCWAVEEEKQSCNSKQKNERATMERSLVSAATGAMTSLLGKLGTMLTDEYKLLQDVRGDIEFLKRELEVMQAFLHAMADVEEPDHQTELHVDAVRELSYDIEDKIDKFMSLVNHESSSKLESFKELFSKSMKKITNLKTP